MPIHDIPTHEAVFRRTLAECRELYVSSGRLCVEEIPHRLPQSRGSKSQPEHDFVELMDDLHRGLVLKVYFAVCEADRSWSSRERVLAEVLFEHLWQQRLDGQALRTAARKMAGKATRLKWYSIVRPFDQISLLRERVGELETLVMRLAHIVARADGKLHPTEAAAIKSIQHELHHHLRPIPIDQPHEHTATEAIGNQAIEALQHEADDIAAAGRPEALDQWQPGEPSPRTTPGRPPRRATAPSLDEALQELAALIGLERIKHEVRTLTNFLQLQQRRQQAGLPDTEIGLHMVFAGNPGTGKTTVARIVGKIFAAMGVLQKGHLVETDRSGLVAEFAGQTGPKTHAKIDEALDGVLFVDEAYSLAPHAGQDAYGSEAVQALLKRAEDDRQRLVVILAGYPDQMRRLLSSNPGLSSRFNRVLDFADYAPLELACIFGAMCDKNHYTLPAGMRARLLLGLTELHRRRDEHFGNGRAVRNLFEQTIRRMANRIARIAELSEEQLVLLDEADLEFAGLPAGWHTQLDRCSPKFRLACPGCQHTSDAPGRLLGQQVRCPKCQQDFLAEWGEVVEDGSS